MRIPEELTIVFAGVETRDKPMLARAKVDAIMCSFEKLRGNKRFIESVREGFEGNPVTYLDSGVFTLMRRAGVTSFAPTREAGQLETIKAGVIKLAKQYEDYLATDLKHWDWVIELDVDEAFGARHYDLGVETRKKLRARLRKQVGEKLLPVWHAIPGADEEWSQLIREYPYVCISGSRAISGTRGRRNNSMVRRMVAEAHSVGTKVHMLGVSTLDHFQTYEVDTMDSSGWSSIVRWGEFKVTDGKMYFPKYDRRNLSKRRAIEHSRLLQLTELLDGWGITFEEMQANYLVQIEVGIRLLELRQQELRRTRGRTNAQAVS